LQSDFLVTTHRSAQGLCVGRLPLTVVQLRIAFLHSVVPLYNDQADVLLMMTTSLSTTHLLIQSLGKIRQRELNPGIKDFDEKIQIIANLTFSLVVALFKPQNLNWQQRCGDPHPRAAAFSTQSSASRSFYVKEFPFC
jgi:hypothetical protein